MSNTLNAQLVNELVSDMTSFAHFMYKPAGFQVQRRLAPPIDTLQFYINRFNSLNGDFSSSVSVALSNLDSSVAEADGKVAYIETTVRDAINQSILASGFITIDSFELGATITQRNQALRHATDGKLYRWAGDLPKVVSTNSTPTSSGGMGDNAWLEVSDVTLRQDLANPDTGALMVRGAVIYVNTIADLQALPTSRVIDGQRALVAGTVFTYHTSTDEWQTQGPMQLSSLGAEIVGYGVIDGLLATTKQLSVDTQIAATIPDTPTFASYGSNTDNVFVAVQLFGGEVITGDALHTIRPYSNGTEFDGTSFQALFATAIPRALGYSVENITVDGVCVDVGSLGPYMTNPRFFRFASARNIKLNNIKALRSEGERRGYVASFLNCADVVVDNFDVDGITGGINLQFCDGVILNNIRMNNFNEGIDIDSANHNVVARNLIFTNNAGGNECIEVESSQGVLIDGVVANNVGVLLDSRFKPHFPRSR